MHWFSKAADQGDSMARMALGALRQQQAAAAAAATRRKLPAAEAPSPIPIGARVELRGLQAKPELNGQRGVVVGFKAESGRCEVKLDDGSGSFRLKPGNLHRDYEVDCLD